jgi:hypothetical protein
MTYAASGRDVLRVRTVRGALGWEPVAGTRIDLPGRSGVHLEWTGQHIYCTGDPDLIDGLELRTATAADFARYTAEFEEYIAQRRAQG